jgi:hypothetical protein
MPRELVGLVINPKKNSKKKSRRKRSEGRKSSVRAKAGRNVILITNPARDHQALLELSLGAAAGLAGGKLLDRAVLSSIKLPIPAGVSLGDLSMLGVGAFLLKQGGRKKEFATGVVAGAGAKILLNLLDNFLFHNKGVVALHGEEDYIEPYPEIEPFMEEDIDEPAELGQIESEPLEEIEEVGEEEESELPEIQTL